MNDECNVPSEDHDHSKINGISETTTNQSEFEQCSNKKLKLDTCGGEGDGFVGSPPHCHSPQQGRNEGERREEEVVVVMEQKQQRKKHIDPQVLKVRHSIHVCCKSDDLLSALQIYREALAQGVRMEPQTYYSLLALCDGLDARGLHIGTPRPTTSELKKEQQQQQVHQQQQLSNAHDSSRIITPEERRNYAFEIKQSMDQHKVPFSETAYTSLVRVLCKAGESALAEQILREAESKSTTVKLKLRLYSAVLQAMSQKKQISSMVSLWKRMISLNIHLSEREYTHVLQCAIGVGTVPEVVDRVLAELAEDVLVPSQETTRSIMDWFSSPHATSSSSVSSVTGNGETNDIITTPILGETTAPSLGPVVARGGWTISYKCHIDTKTGMLLDGCLKNSYLKPVELSSEDRLELIRMNDTIVINDSLPSDTSVYAGGGKGRKRKSADKDMRAQTWESFKLWLEKNLGSASNESGGTTSPPYEVVIDGANVGYYKQNYANAPKHVEYHQIDWVVRHFQRMKKKVLLVLHERHFSPKLMPRWAKPITARWQNSTANVDGLTLYRAKAGCNDDWFWLHAALRCGSMVVTNDEMRDHHFQMLAYRSFLRWKERHQIRFALGEWVTSVQEDGLTPYRYREVKTYYPDIYSRRIQRVEHGIIVPLPKKGDEDRFLDGSFMAEDVDEEETYLCIAENI
jgi:pentatricopeptide repeat protein